MEEGEGKVDGQPQIDTFDERQAEELIDIRHRDGTLGEYVLREMGGQDLKKWQTSLARRFVTDRRGRPVKADYEGLFSELISYGLFERKSGKKVGQATIEEWGVKCKMGLFEKAQRLNGLNDDFSKFEGKD